MQTNVFIYYVMMQLLAKNPLRDSKREYIIIYYVYFGCNIFFYFLFYLSISKGIFYRTRKISKVNYSFFSPQICGKFPMKPICLERAEKAKFGVKRSPEYDFCRSCIQMSYIFHPDGIFNN